MPKMRWSTISLLGMVGWALVSCGAHEPITDDDLDIDASTGDAATDGNGNAGAGGAGGTRPTGAGGASGSAGIGVAGSGNTAGSGGSGGTGGTGRAGSGGAAGGGGTIVPPGDAGPGGAPPRDAGMVDTADTSAPPLDANRPIDTSTPPPMDVGPPPPRPLACGGPPGVPDDIDDSGTLRQRFIGVWLLCSATSWLGTSDEVGLEFTDDGKWYKLYATPSGGLVRGAGVDREGTWEQPERYYVAVQILGAGTASLMHAFSKSPRRMRLNNFGVWIADYIDAGLADGGVGIPPDAGPTPEAGTPDAGIPAECSQGGVPVDVPDYTTFLAQLAGKWLTCQKPTVFDTSDEVGLEITSDGHWYKLYLGASGGLERGTGFDRQGTWYKLATDAGSGQTNFQIFGSGEILTFPEFTHSPRRLRLVTSGLYNGNYVNVVP